MNLPKLAINTALLQPSELDRAIELLASGGIVGVPTETVYGLAADARNESAVQKIFAAKERPSSNPLIVHVASIDQALRFAAIEHDWIYACLQRFSPGPISFVLPYRGGLASSVTAGLSTVAVRIPQQATLSLILERSGLPLAAPSANRSGRPSATTWQAVHEDLAGRIDAIICDQPCQWGLESTVVDATTPCPIVLRAGAVTLAELQQVAPAATSQLADAAIGHRSPGTRFRHYQPRAKVLVRSQLAKDDLQLGETAAVICLQGFVPESCRDAFQVICSCETVEAYASKLFAFFREADSLNAEWIICQAISQQGLGAALMDRIQRAAATEPD